MTILHIDTTNNKEVTVGLKRDGKEFIEKKPLDTRKAQVVLPMLEEMLFGLSSLEMFSMSVE